MVAMLQESRPVAARPLVPTITSVVIASSTAPTSSSSTTTNKEDDVLDNELDPKPTPSTSTTTNKPTTRPSRKRFSLTTKYPVESSAATPTKKSTFPSRKSSKVVRSTAQPSVTTSQKEHKFHAKFSSTLSPPLLRSSESTVKVGRGTLPPRGLYSSRKVKEGKGEVQEKGRKGYVESAVQSAQAPKSFSQKKNSRFSSKYRGDTSQRGYASRSTTGAPAYIPTVPTAVYIPTVPTVTPSRTTVNSGAGSKDAVVGLEIISFDDPVNTVPSANLINEEYISSSTENALNNPVSLVTEGTTEKPVSIIERIINSITAMSTTAPPDTLKQTSTASTTESSSAILKLAPKKPTKHDKTKHDETLHSYPVATVAFTTEKPTTIIERILSSLSAIQATDDTNSNQVGKDFNTISFPPTTPVSRVTTSRITLPAQISTSINPLSVLDEITPEQVLEKRTIGKLLAILNGLLTTEHPQKLVVVTPKTSNFVTGIGAAISTAGTTEATTTQPPISAPLTISTTTTSFPTNEDTTPELFTSPLDPQSFNVGTTQSETNPIPASPIVQTGTTTESPLGFTQTELTQTTASAQTEAMTPTTTQQSPEAVPLSLDRDSSTETATRNTFPSTTEAGLTGTTDISTLITYLSTIPTLQNFEVSPGSVSVFSANDLSNSITTEDSIGTVTIAGRSNFDITATTDSTTTETGTIEAITEPVFTTQTPELATVVQSSTVSTSGGTTQTADVDNQNDVNQEVAVTDTVDSENDVTEATTTVQDGTTIAQVGDDGSAAQGGAVESSSTPPQNTSAPCTCPPTAKVTTNGDSNRSGRLLNVVQDPVQNSIDVVTPSTTTSTTPDYYVFAVLNNDTVLRKKPPTIPNKDTPYVIVGLFPNNTVVRKFPNGTLVPMEQIIRVDENTVPTLESNPLSVDNVSGTSAATEPITTTSTTTQSTVASTGTDTSKAPQTESGTNSNAESSTVSESSVSTVDSTTVGRITNAATTTTPGSTVPNTTPAPSTTPGTTVGSSANTDPTLPTLSELLNGRTLEVLNSIINVTNTNSNTNFKTLQVNQYNQVLNIQDLIKQNSKDNANVVFRWKPIENTSEATTPGPALTTAAAETTVPPIDTTTFMTVTPAETTPQNQPTESVTQGGDPLPLSNVGIEEVTAPQASSTQVVTPPPTTAQPSTTPRLTSTPVETLITSTGSPKTTTASSTFPTVTFFPTFPTFITTLFPNLLRGTTQTPATTTTTTAPSETIAISASTVQPTTVVVPSSTVTPKLKQLTEQQKKDLETLAQLEKEQAALLQQLSFLTSLNFGGNRNGRNKESSNLANRVSGFSCESIYSVIQLAVERTKSTTTSKPVPKNIQDQLPSIEDPSKTGKKEQQPSIEDVLKQYNLTGVDIATPAPPTPTSPYGNSDDAILAALLKEQGINPPTPKSLAEQIKQAGVFDETTTTRRPRPRPSQRPPGRLMQGLNWLLNALAPPPQPAPRTTKKPKPVKPKKPPVEQELLTNSPTHLTPIVTSAPKANSLTQEDVQKLIKQLETVQKDPKNTDALDFSQIKSLQTLLNTNDGVEVASNGQHGATSRGTTEVAVTRRRQEKKASTTVPPSVSNSLEEEEVEEVTTPRPRPALPPLRLRPVPGVDDNPEPLIRGNLITAAVNVTRAISGFLGTALQGAAQSFQSLLGSGSRLAQASSSRPG
ncbi:hypothetical protein NQ315_002163 [Exocentrus adspersus]|uniref:Uncharacterized protein n=1 Tax=Exocentrus adspersus TaxID=1586481 RepID=A0AAV8VZX8_9CUCU|nr:hypothetical protein NQ315_002163 [Exocentrus adspersus]